MSQLRKVLDGTEPEIVTRARGYELRVPADAVDAVRFERLVEEADGANGKANEALALWRGPPLDDVADEPFAAAEIRRLDDLYLRARELAVDAALAAGEHSRVVGELEALVAEHPLRERLHAQRMLALYRSGRQAEALEAYRHARGVLVEEIGIEPGPELRRLHDAILRQDPELDAPARTTTLALPARSARRALALVAVVVIIAGLAAFALIRWLGPDSLARIDADWVGLIDTGDRRITTQYEVGHAPGAIAAGGGSVWVANTRDGTVSRIDGEDEPVITIPVGGEPTAIAFGERSLWVADGEGRRRLNLAIDRSRVVELLGGSVLADRSCQIIPPGLPGYVPACPYTRSPAAGVWTGPDLTRARQLVAASGTQGARVDVRGIAAPPGVVVRYAARVLRQLGYNARARLTPDIDGHFAFVNDSRNRAQIGFYGWIADYLTPSTFIEWAFTCRRLIPGSSASINASQFCDRQVDRDFDRAYREASVAGWATLDRKLLGSAPADPLVSRRAILLVSDRVGNVDQHGATQFPESRPAQLGPLLDQFWVR